MTIRHEGVDIYVLPEFAVCKADKGQRSPDSMYDCPCRHSECDPYTCEYYSEGSGTDSMEALGA